jgi:DNA-binding phage protein
MLSERGNPEVKSLFTLLHTMGLRLAVGSNKGTKLKE